MLKANTIVLFLFLCTSCDAQFIAFRHLATGNGLSDNKVACMTTDKNGFLWIGTTYGLNEFDGYGVKHFYKEKNTGLASNDISALFCDSRNRIWVGTPEGITMIDQERRFHTIALDDTLSKNYKCTAIFETEALGIVVYTNKGNFSFDEKNNKWTFLRWSFEAQSGIRWKDHAALNNNVTIETGKDTLILMDYGRQQKTFEFPLNYTVSACRYNDDEILAAIAMGKLFRISISRHKIIKEYLLSSTLNGRRITTDIAAVRPAPDGRIIVATRSAGMYIFDPATEQFSQYMHNALRPGSLAANDVDRIYGDITGNVFLTIPGRGVDYFNMIQYKTSNMVNFEGRDSGLYDNDVNGITQTDPDHLLIAGHDRLIDWSLGDQRSHFYYYYFPMTGKEERPLDINSVYKDSKGRIWVATHRGIGLLNKQTEAFKIFTRDTLKGRLPNLSNNFIDDIVEVADGKLWLSTYSGLISFDPDSFQYDSLKNDRVLGKLPSRRLWKVFQGSNGKTWLGYSSMIVCINKDSTLKTFGKKEGLAGERVTAMLEDDIGNLYVATYLGLTIIDAVGQLKTFNAGNGLRYNDCEGLLKDGAGNIWISNHNCLVKYDPAQGRFNFFDEKNGLSGENFVVDAACAAGDGTLYWGTAKGISFFSPEKIVPYVSPANVIISQADIGDSSFYFTRDGKLSLEHDQYPVSFHFGVTDLYSNDHIVYQYQLEGLDNTWINNFEQRQVTYSALAPGKYTFRIRASFDGVNWTQSVNTIIIMVRPAFWQTWWFKTLLILLLVGLAWYLFRRRIAAVKENEKVRSGYERKIAQVEMSSLRAQMNPHFMFNSLNSINNFILKNDPENASGYLTKFSRLMRLILDNSRNEWVPLEQELKALELYIDLEALRFENSFGHHIEITRDVDPVATMIPPMIIQPYVENAIWHGLLHRKEAGAKLDIRIWRNGQTINISVEDNGIGREEAARRKSKSALQKSHGMDITRQRLDIVNSLYGVDAKVTINDITDDQGKPAGTYVLLNLNFKNNDSDNSR